MLVGHWASEYLQSFLTPESLVGYKLDTQPNTEYTESIKLTHFGTAGF